MKSSNFYRIYFSHQTLKTIPTLIIKFLCLDNILLTVILQVLMARWKISSNFIEEMAIKMLNTTAYIQNKNNLANTIMCLMTKMESTFIQMHMTVVHFHLIFVQKR